MHVRKPAVAGYFYPDAEQACRSEVEAYLAAAETPAQAEEGRSADELRSALEQRQTRLIGGIVPHAGWMCSGAVAAEVLGLLCRQPGIETVVVFGAAHRFASTRAALLGAGGWATPLGDVAIDEELAAAVLSSSEDVEDNPEPHIPEHSIEVQVPFIKHLAPQARILPLLVPHTSPAPAIGLAVAEQVKLLNRQAVFVGSTDLTHYGPRYGFTPHGSRQAGLDWARNVNDQAIIDAICRMDAEGVVSLAVKSQSACGSGAVAATLAASKRIGATHAVLLRHVTSQEVLRDRYGEMTDAVGYAGIVFEENAERKAAAK